MAESPKPTEANGPFLSLLSMLMIKNNADLPRQARDERKEACLKNALTQAKRTCRPASSGEHGFTPTLCIPSACTVRHCCASSLRRVWLDVIVQSCSRAPQQPVGSLHIAEAALLLPAKNASSFFSEFSLCLSRACLGNTITFIYKWLKRGVFSHRSSTSSLRPPSYTSCRWRRRSHRPARCPPSGTRPSRPCRSYRWRAATTAAAGRLRRTAR
jgi:hypothetical protein